MASATAPPTPVSISSKIRVGAEPLSASTTLSASMKRDSSPPDATLSNGPGRVPGFVCAQNSTRSKPAASRLPSSVSIFVMKVARSSLRGGSSACTAWSRACAAFCRPAVSARAAVTYAPSASASVALQRRELLLAGVDRRDIRGEAVAQGREVVGRNVMLPRGGPERKEALLGLLQVAGVELGRAQRRFQGGLRLVDGDERGVERAHAGLDQRRRLRRAPFKLAHRGRERRSRRPLPRDGVIGVVEVLRHLLGLHHHEPPVGERRLFAGLRGQRRQFLDGVAQEIGLLARRLDTGAMLG